MSLWQATTRGFKNYFDFKGRATRSEFWYFLLFFILAYIVVWLIDQLFLPPILNLKDLPFGHVWNEFCARMNCPSGLHLIDQLKRYQSGVSGR